MNALIASIHAQHGPDCIRQLALAIYDRCDWPVKPAQGDPFWTRRAVKMAEQAHIPFVMPGERSSHLRGDLPPREEDGVSALLARRLQTGFLPHRGSRTSGGPDA